MAGRRDLVSVKMERKAYKYVKTAASWLSVTVAEYLTEAALGAAKRDLEAMRREREREEEAEP